MPTIVIRERQDRQGNVPVSIITGKTEQRQIIKRGEITMVSDEILDTLMSSHEADYVQVITNVQGQAENYTEDNDELRHRGPGRPRKVEMEV